MVLGNCSSQLTTKGCGCSVVLHPQPLEGNQLDLRLPALQLVMLHSVWPRVMSGEPGFICGLGPCAKLFLDHLHNPQCPQQHVPRQGISAPSCRSCPWGQVTRCRTQAEATTTCLSSPVNGSKTGRTLVENFSPNQTRFTVQRTDPISRYRFFLRARTQVGDGEVIVEESPALLNEGECRAAPGVGLEVMIQALAKKCRSEDPMIPRATRVR